MAGNPDAIEGFVAKIFQTPTILALPPLLKEEQVKLFVETNSQSLRALFASRDMMPGVPWSEIEREIRERVSIIANDTISATYSRLLSSISFVPGAGKDELVPFDDRKRRQILDLAVGALRSQGARAVFQGDFNALATDTWSRYVDRAFSDRGYVFFELTRFDQSRLQSDQLKIVLALALALRPWLFGEHLLDDRGRGATLQPSNPSFAQRMRQHVADVLPYLPESVSKACADSSLPFEPSDRSISASGRFVAIIAGRARFLRAAVKSDRGADSPDKSWFAAARKNAAYFGYDGRMLEDFYRIASDQGW